VACSLREALTPNPLSQWKRGLLLGFWEEGNRGHPCYPVSGHGPLHPRLATLTLNIYTVA
jgi:hypothetical protein